MNVWQVAKQLRRVLRQAIWGPPGGGGSLVFGSVFITVKRPPESSEHALYPMALIRPLNADQDPDKDEETGLLLQRFAIRTAVDVEFDGFGESSIVGANRAGGALSSDGKGILEVEEPLLAAVKLLTSETGVRVISRVKSEVDLEEDEETEGITYREYLVEAFVRDERFYHPATRLAGTDGGGGQAILTWKIPPDRFDLFRLRLFRAAGAVPPAFGGGTEVVLPAPPPIVAGVTDTPGAGTFSYSLFAMYDEENEPPSADGPRSAAETLSSLVVT